MTAFPHLARSSITVKGVRLVGLVVVQIRSNPPSEPSHCKPWLSVPMGPAGNCIEPRGVS